MKIISWDEKNLNLVVKFVSDDSSLNIDDTTALAYQPITMFPGVSDTQELIKKMAVSGISICEVQNLQQQAKQDQAKINEIKNLVGQTFEYTVEELLNLE